MLVALGCSKRSDSGEPADAAPSSDGAATVSASASGVAPSAPRVRCRASDGAASFELGAQGARPNSAGGDEEDQAEFLPFAIEVGKAAVFGRGYAVSALQSESGATHAVVSVIDGQRGTGTTLDLGRSFGDVEAPALATAGEAVLVVMPQAEPNGQSLQLLRLEGDFAQPKLVRGANLSYASMQGEALDVAASASHAAIAWTARERKSGEPVIMTVAVDPMKLAARAEPQLASPAGVAAEAPRLAARPGGYWLAYVTPQPTSKRPDGGAPVQQPDDLLLDLGPRSLSLVALDERGVPVGAPLRLTEPSAHVMAFDLMASTNDGALLAWRDDEATPGAEIGRVYLAAVRRDGTVSHQQIDDEDVGSGIPALLAGGGGGAPDWLVLSGQNDVARLVPLDGTGRPVAELRPEAALAGAEPLLLTGGKMLVAAPRGLGAAFSLLDCAMAGQPRRAP